MRGDMQGRVSTCCLLKTKPTTAIAKLNSIFNSAAVTIIHVSNKNEVLIKRLNGARCHPTFAPGYLVINSQPSEIYKKHHDGLFYTCLAGFNFPGVGNPPELYCTWDTITPSRSLIWCSCYDGFFGAKLDVPLDYQNTKLGRASVPLIKLPANPTSSYGPYQGMVLINPGGPGGSSVDEVQNNGVAYYQAGPSQCSFFTGSSALSIFSRFNQSFVRLNPQEAKAKNWANATDIESALLTLKTALSGSVALPTEAIVMLVGNPTPAGDANAEFRLGTLCTDQGNKWYNKSLEDLSPAIEHLREVSIIGEIIIKSMLGCLSWSIKAAEAYSGPFGGDTQTPILFVGNTYDPVSPVTNALAAAPKYKDAQVVTVDATGHTSRMTDNTCQKPKVNAYFQTTQLPGNDSYCALEAGSLGIVLNATLEDIINQASLSQLQVG
ncbi:hypothetical protein CHU98_g8869 [Xylaria longipes]|nr:hypothetical protein CHU98_g8869 [Xylaria longipes]